MTCRQRERDIVLQAGDALYFDPGCRLELVARDHGADFPPDYLGLDAEAIQHALEVLGHLLRVAFA